LREVLPYLDSLLKPGGNIIIFNGWSTVSDTISALSEYFTMRNWIIYDRIKGRGAKYNLVSTREDILWFSKGEKEDYTFNKQMSNIPKKTGGLGKKNGEENRALSNVWTDISPIVPWSKERNGHPTQKPVQLMERCVKLWSNEGDVILDFTMGSGSTGEAAKKNGRSFIGIEKSEDYLEIAFHRLLTPSCEEK
jgi:site-specific DNA-methyltransferase (adenine-specific)